MGAVDECPAGCGRRRKRGHLMCAPCWYEVPEHLKAEVLRTWKAWRKKMGSAELMQAYQFAHDAAIGSIR